MTNLPTEHERRSSTLEEPLARAIAIIREHVQSEKQAEAAKVKEAATKQVEEYKIQVAQAQSLLKDTETKLISANEQVTSLMGQLQTRENELIKAQHVQTSLDERIQDQQLQLERLRDELQLKVRELKDVQEQLSESLKAQAHELTSHHEEEMRQLQLGFERQQTRLNQELETARSNHQQLRAELEKQLRAETQIQTQNMDYASQIKRLETNLEFVRADLKQAEERLKLNDHSLSGHQTEIQQARLIIEDDKRQKEKQHLELSQSKAYVAHLEEELKFAQAESDRLRSKFSAYKTHEHHNQQD